MQGDHQLHIERQARKSQPPHRQKAHLHAIMHHPMRPINHLHAIIHHVGHAANDRQTLERPGRRAASTFSKRPCEQEGDEHHGGGQPCMQPKESIHAANPMAMHEASTLPIPSSAANRRVANASMGGQRMCVGSPGTGSFGSMRAASVASS
ncbi:hypothetical protein Dimus_032201 [Dionaea muscipula]